MFTRAVVWMPLMVIGLLAGCAADQRMDSSPSGRAERGQGQRQTIVFSITSGMDKPEAVALALQMAVHALLADRDVVVFFNLAGVQMAVRRLPEEMPMAEQIANSLRTLASNPGATILVCGQCLQSHRIAAEDIVEGARPATAGNLFGAIGPNTVVFTY